MSRFDSSLAQHAHTSSGNAGLNHTDPDDPHRQARDGSLSDSEDSAGCGQSYPASQSDVEAAGRSLLFFFDLRGNFISCAFLLPIGTLTEDTQLTAQTLNADGTPKRPMNAFMIFARRRRPQVSAANHMMRTGEISKILSKEWTTMDMVSLSPRSNF